MKNAITILAVLLITALLIVGCGKKEAAPAATTPAATTPAATTPAATTPAAPSEGEAEAEAEAPVIGDMVLIQTRAFEPATITTTVGGTITWKNADEVRAHIVAAKDGLFKSPRLAAGEMYSFTFETAGTYAYTDPVMGTKGTVEVIE